MTLRDILDTIRSPWLDRISHQLSKGEASREALLPELNRFFDLLIQAVETGDPGWLKPILIEWSSARTESELENEELSIPPVLAKIVEETNTVGREELTPDQALDLQATLLPIFTYAYEIVAQAELRIRMGYVESRIDSVQGEMERLDRSKSDFIAVAAHELKTPLTLIEGYSSMMREQFEDESETSPQLLLLKGVDNGIRRLGEIINDMVDVSMIDNNLLSLNFQPTWLNRLFEVLENDAQKYVAERNQTLEIKEFPGIAEMTFADSERIYQALRNLITNAIKYTPDGGRIVVDGRRLSGFIEITVTDSGIGIDPDDQARIFEKFGRLGEVSLHSSGKVKFKGGGPGLGLPITKGILNAHGGTVWVESDGYDEDKMPGSTFHVLLPLRTEPPDDKVAKLFGSLSDSPDN